MQREASRYWPEGPEMRCEVFSFLMMMTGGSGGTTPPTFTMGGVFGVNGLGFFVFGAPEGF